MKRQTKLEIAEVLDAIDGEVMLPYDGTTQSTTILTLVARLRRILFTL